MNQLRINFFPVKAEREYSSSTKCPACGTVWQPTYWGYQHGNEVSDNPFTMGGHCRYCLREKFNDWHDREGFIKLFPDTMSMIIMANIADCDYAKVDHLQIKDKGLREALWSVLHNIKKDDMERDVNQICRENAMDFTDYMVSIDGGYDYVVRNND